MKHGLMKHLVCPDCKKDLKCESRREEKGEIIEGQVLCSRCNLKFPISEGVPDFLDQGRLTRRERQSALGFGYKWKRNPEMLRSFRDQFLEEIKPLSPAVFKGQTILDACCGIGTITNTCLQYGAKEVVAFDMSESVYIAKENNKAFPNAHFLRADIFRMPLRGGFDHVVCVAAVHATKDPRKGFGLLVKQAGPGGRVTIWVYGKEGNELVIRYIDPFRKYVTSLIHPRAVEALSFPLSLALWGAVHGLYSPAHRRKGLAPIARRLPLNQYMMYTSNWPFAKLFEMVVDQLVSPFTYYYSGKDLEEWYRSEGMKEISANQVYGNSWNATGVKSRSSPR